MKMIKLYIDMMLSECDNNVEETERGVGPSVICSVVDHSS